MGTNYYFKPKKEEEIMSCIKAKVPYIEDTSDIKELLRIHIGKKSMGWKPLLRATKYYRNTTELEIFYQKNKELIEIVNEYGDVKEWDDLERIMLTYREDENETVPELQSYIDEQGNEWTEREFC